MKVDVWSDIVCPWCYIGKARLQHALADFPHRQQVEVTYRSYQLDPTFPVGEPVPVLEMFATKYGLSAEQAANAEARVAALARAEGLPYVTDRQHGNTATAHRLLHHARQNGQGEQLLDRLFRTNFGGQASIFDNDVLLELAVATGLDRADTLSVITGDRYADAVEQDVDTARQLGIRGVPFFLVDGRLGVSGAQPTDTLAQILTAAWSEQA
ncbi:MAG: protein-disulfide isomerase [Acidimicrobiia bacterium]|nr:protein-disulfide isomerase [Acidimicrobiia bacterium]